MEEWQRKHIKANLPELVQSTECSAILLAYLISREVLCDLDVIDIKGQSDFMEQSFKLYEIVQTRIHSYEKLLEALQLSKQSGAHQILYSVYENLTSDVTGYKESPQFWARASKEGFSKPVAPSSSDDQTVHVFKEVFKYGTFNSVVFKGVYHDIDILIKKSPQLKGNLIELEKEVFKVRNLENHANILRHFFVSVNGNHIVMAMEIHDTSLDACLESDTLPVSTQEIFRQVTQGLEFLHGKRIVHGNLKPSNILMSSSSPVVKLSDFGMHKIHAELVENFLKNDVDIGVIDWMAPEVLRCYEEWNCTPMQIRQSDIFSLGCIYYAIITKGQHPFGNILRRAMNLLNYKYNIDQRHVKRLEYKRALSLIDLMISPRPLVRPLPVAILQHPMLWSNKKTMDFLRAITEFVLENNEAMKVVIKLQNCIRDLILSWSIKLPKKLDDILDVKGVSYNKNSILDIIKVTIFLYENINIESKNVENFSKASKDHVYIFNESLLKLTEIIWLAFQIFKQSSILSDFYEKGHYFQVSKYLLALYPALRECFLNADSYCTPSNLCESSIDNNTFKQSDIHENCKILDNIEHLICHTVNSEELMIMLMEDKLFNRQELKYLCELQTNQGNEAFAHGLYSLIQKNSNGLGKLVINLFDCKQVTATKILENGNLVDTATNEASKKEESMSNPTNDEKMAYCGLYLLNLKNVDIRKVLEKLVPSFLAIMTNKDVNTLIISQLIKRDYFGDAVSEEINNHNYGTEMTRMNTVFSLIMSQGTDVIIRCLERLCDLEGLPKVSRKFRTIINDSFPGAVVHIIQPD